MRRLKLAFVSTGSFYHIRPYLTFFRDRGHEVHWIVCTKPFEVPGISLHDLSYGGNPQSSRLAKWRYLLSVPPLRRLLRKLHPDIVHGHYTTSAGMLCLLSGYRPYVLSVRGTDLIGSVRSHVWRCLLGLAFHRAALMHTVSEQLAGIVLHMGVPAGRCLITTQGVDLNRLAYQPLAQDGDPIELICTRHLHPTYDPLTIVKACGILKTRQINFKMTFAAGGPLSKEVQARVSEEGLSDRVVFLDGYDNNRVAELLSRCSIYVSASRWDGTSISLLEAMACGVFPVVSRILSNEAWIEDGVNGLVFEPGDAECLADTLAVAVADRQLRRDAVSRSRRIVEQRGDRARNMMLLEQRYFSILE